MLNGAGTRLSGLTKIGEQGRHAHNLSGLRCLSISQFWLAFRIDASSAVSIRRNSKLPQLVDLFIAHPFVSILLARKKLKVTAAAVDRMLGAHGAWTLSRLGSVVTVVD